MFNPSSNDLADMPCGEKAKHTIPMIAASPKFHGILVRMPNNANMMPDFTNWLEIARAPPSGYSEMQGGRTSVRLGVRSRMANSEPLRGIFRCTSSLTTLSSSSAEAESPRGEGKGLSDEVDKRIQFAELTPPTCKDYGLAWRAALVLF